MAPAPCKIDAGQLISYLDNPSAAPDLPQHVAQCRFCQARLLAIGAAANNQGPGRIEHLRHGEALLRYLEDEASGQVEETGHLPLLTHLAVCQDCYALYRELRTMDEWVMALVDSPVVSGLYRPPDLSFLQRAAETAQPAALPADPKTLVKASIEWLLGTLRMDLGLLFQPPTSAPSAVRAVQRWVVTGKDVVAVKEISLGAEQVKELDVDVRLYTDPQDRSRTRLEVYARAVDRPDLDFTGTVVAVRLADGQQISHLTDELGLARFEGLPEDALRTAVLEITPRAPQL